MRIMVFFDLPVVEREDRKRYNKFRKFLLNDGYDMVQFSVYCRLVNGEDAIEKHVNRLNANLPPVGSIRFLQITDKQYGKMKFLVGSPKKKEKMANTEQMSLF